MDLPTYSYDQIANQLTDGYWNGLGGHRHTFAVSSGGSVSVNITGLTAAGQQLAHWALDAWSAVSGIRFNFLTTAAAITFDDNQAGAYSSYRSSGMTTLSASVNVSTDWLAAYGTSQNSYSLQTYIHEIGHSLGLGHGGNYNGDATYGVNNSYTNDSWQASVMSYFSQNDNPTVNASYAFATTPMAADIIAIHNLYGSANSHSGDDTYAFQNSVGNAVALTLFDTGGYDILDFSSVSKTQIIDLRPEHYSDVQGLKGNLGIARDSYIESVKGGSAQDMIIGNQIDNRFEGKAGNDIIYGSGGQDTGLFAAKVSDATLYKFVEGAVVSAAELGNDQLFDMEWLEFSDGSKSLAPTGADRVIFEYGASYKDLISAFGINDSALFSHLANYGIREGRTITFDAKQYLGSYSDLRATFGNDISLAAKHFIGYGSAEGRTDKAFNVMEYIASYGDLITALGSNSDAGLLHFQQYGFNEGRGDNFDGLTYIASYGDLIEAFHDDPTAGAEHFIDYGHSERRQASFDAYSYVHATGNGDLLAAFGSNLEGAVVHYIDYGFHEGRLL